MSLQIRWRVRQRRQCEGKDREAKAEENKLVDVKVIRNTDEALAQAGSDVDCNHRSVILWITASSMAWRAAGVLWGGS